MGFDRFCRWILLVYRSLINCHYPIRFRKSYSHSLQSYISVYYAVYYDYLNSCRESDEIGKGNRNKELFEKIIILTY